jgi:Ni/Co efflux regulator RcnB
MKRLIITTLAATLLASTALSGTAMAAGQRHDDRRDDRYEQRHDQRDYRHDRRDYRHDRKDERKAYRHWQRGQRLDARYRDNRYYVRDYHRYGLRAPPRGYRWQRVDDSYILAAVATGVILSVIIANN